MREVHTERCLYVPVDCGVKGRERRAPSPRIINVVRLARRLESLDVSDAGGLSVPSRFRGGSPCNSPSTCHSTLKCVHGRTLVFVPYEHGVKLGAVGRPSDINSLLDVTFSMLQLPFSSARSAAQCGGCGHIRPLRIVLAVLVDRPAAAAMAAGRNSFRPGATAMMPILARMS